MEDQSDQAVMQFILSLYYQPSLIPVEDWNNAVQHGGSIISISSSSWWDRPTARKGLLFVSRLLRRAGYAVCGHGGAALLVWTVMNTRPSRQCSRLVTSKAVLHTPHRLVSPAAPQNVNRMSTSGRIMGERNPIASSLTFIFQARKEDLEKLYS